MILKLLSVAAAAVAMAASAAAQAPPDLHKRLTGLGPIDTPLGITRIRNAEDDGRDVQVIHTWRDNGNAWGFGVFMVTMPRKPEFSITDWTIVGIVEGDDLATEITDVPHTGEDDLKVVRFARGTLDGKPTTFLIVAQRNPTGPVPSPAVAKIRIFALFYVEDTVGVGSTPDVFKPVFEYTTAKTYTDADNALHEELGLPLPREG